MKYIVIILLLLLAYAGVAYMSLNRKLDRQLSMSILNDSNLQKKILDIRDSSGREIQIYQIKTITQEQLLTSNSEEAKQLREDLHLINGKLKRLISSTSVGSVTHDTVKIPVEKIIKLTDTGSFSIPIATYRPDSFITLSGSSQFRRIASGFKFENVNLDYTLINKSSITYFNKTRFLRKTLLELQVTQDNPKTITNKIQTYYITPEKKWYQKTGAHIATGIVIGLGIGAFYLK